MAEIVLEKVAEGIFGMTPRHYRRLAQSEIVPRPIKGKIDFLEAVKKLIAYYRGLSEGKGIDALMTARKENVQLKNDLLRLEKLVKEGQLISRSDVLAEFLWRIKTVKQGLFSLHRILPQELVGKDAHEMGSVIKKHVFELLERYSRRSGVLKQ